MQIREIMTPNPACCTPDSSLREVARMMQENDCGCIPVVDSRAQMKPVGTITDRDITIRTVAAGHNPLDMKASEIMTTDVATVRPQMSVEECFDVMEDREIRRVLVVDEQGKCCGIVAQADVVQSNTSPARTNKVIREISESSASYNQRVPVRAQRPINQRPVNQNRRAPMDKRTFKSDSSKESFMSSGSLITLLIGVGSGVGLMYLLNNQQKSARREYKSSPKINVSEHENLLDVTNQESFGKYLDAEQEIEKRQHNLEDRVQAFRKEPNSPLITKAESVNLEDKTVTNTGKDKGRTANNS